jgi:hypothetical protein
MVTSCSSIVMVCECEVALSGRALRHKKEQAGVTPFKPARSIVAEQATNAHRSTKVGSEATIADAE